MSKGQTTADDDDVPVDEARRRTLATRLRRRHVAGVTGTD
jgi:hypothetical protein